MDLGASLDEDSLLARRANRSLPLRHPGRIIRRVLILTQCKANGVAWRHPCRHP